MAEQEDPFKTFIRTTLMVTVRGIVSVVPIRTAEQTLFSICRGLAEVIGLSYAGDDDGVRKFREKCRVEFSAALHQAPVLPMPDGAVKPEAPAEDAAPKPEEPAETFGAPAAGEAVPDAVGEEKAA